MEITAGFKGFWNRYIRYLYNIWLNKKMNTVYLNMSFFLAEISRSVGYTRAGR